MNGESVELLDSFFKTPFKMSDDHTEVKQETIDAFEKEINAGTPTSDVDDLLGDGGVLKTTIKEGTGFETPAIGSEVTVRYIGTLHDGGKEFDRNENFKFSVGKGQVIKGWDETLKTMRLNEICKVTLRSDYAYGSAGAGSSIPPNATLDFEIELKHFSNETDITKKKDGGIMKKIISSGNGYKSPKFESVCEINVTGSYKDRVFEETTKTITIGEETVIPGIEKALKSMKEGEIARFEIKAPYAFGSQGNAEFGIPSDATIFYELELVTLKQEEPYDLDTVADKIAGCELRKAKGNSLFTSGSYARAIKTYQRAIKFVDYLHDASEDEKLKANELKQICQLNIVQCQIKLKRWKDAKNNVEKVLEGDKNNRKGLYRRGLILSELGEWREAKKDFERCLEVDPDNADVKRQLALLDKKIKAQDAKEKALYTKVFSKMK